MSQHPPASPATASVAAAPDPPRQVVERCRRCAKPVVLELDKAYYRETGFCFWCAHVDAQG